MAALLRLAEIQGGCITVDGVDMRSVPLPRLRSAIGVVPQAPFLFEARIPFEHFDFCFAGNVVGERASTIAPAVSCKWERIGRSSASICCIL